MNLIILELEARQLERLERLERLAKQALWLIHIPPLEEINQPHYKVTKPSEQYQFGLLFVSHNIFEGSTYTYI